jgi:hypothetical protein
MRSPCCLSVYPFVSVPLCVCVSPPNIFVFYAVRLVSKESRRLVLPKMSCIVLHSKGKRILEQKLHIYRRYIMIHNLRTSFLLSVVIVASTSQVRGFAVLLPIVGNSNVHCWGNI